MIDQRVALITGSGSGIGAGVAELLAKDGYLVILNSRTADPANLESGAYYYQKVIEENGGRADVYRADIGIAADRLAMVDYISETYGRIDLLVNNAGVAPKVRNDILEQDEGAFDWLMNINLRGPYFLTQLVANRMIQWQGENDENTPRIVFVSSISAYATSTARGEYCISKAGLSMATQLYADRLAEYGIPVIEVRPGIIETPMIETVKVKYQRLASDGLLPAGRLGRPEDIARVISAIGRGDFDYSTGISIDVSGGFQLRRL